MTIAQNCSEQQKSCVLKVSPVWLFVCSSRILESYLCVSQSSCRNLTNFSPEVITCKIADADITEHFKKEESKKSNWEFHNKLYHALKLNKLFVTTRWWKVQNKMTAHVGTLWYVNVHVLQLLQCPFKNGFTVTSVNWS